MIGASLPPFQIAATATGLLTPAEMDGLIADHAAEMQEGRLGDARSDPTVRRSRTVLLKPDERHRWLYERIWLAAEEMNRRYFCVDITAIGSVQIARYDADDSGFYDWHLDFGDRAPNRKLSITVQLSDPADYDGGDLELAFRREPWKADRDRGMIVAFPSWVMHRVSPVTRGVRWSLVGWITGPRWR